MNNRVVKAMEKVKMARKELEAVSRAAYSIDKIITWKRGVTALCEGRILKQDIYCERLFVRNIYTGKEYWISIYDIQ